MECYKTNNWEWNLKENELKKERPIHLHTQTSHKNTKLEDTIILKGPVRSRREAKNMSKKYKNKSNEIKIN